MIDREALAQRLMSLANGSGLRHVHRDAMREAAAYLTSTEAGVVPVGYVCQGTIAVLRAGAPITSTIHPVQYADDEEPLYAAPHPPRQDGAREPVAWMWEEDVNPTGDTTILKTVARFALDSSAAPQFAEVRPLYTTPPAPDEAVEAEREAEREACALICDALAASWEHPTDKDCSTKEGALWYGRRQGAIAVSEGIRARSRRDVGGGV